MAFPIRVRFKLHYHENQGLRKLPEVLSQEMRGSLKGIGKLLTLSAQKRMRMDRGTARRSLTSKVSGQGLNLGVEVYSTLLRAFIDAYGMRVGTRPPWGVGSDLYEWTSRRIRTGQLTSSGKTAYNPVGPRRVFGARARKLRATKKTRALKRTRASKAPVVAVRTRIKQNAMRRVSFLIARSIFEKGIVPSHWNRKALDANRARIIREIRNAVSRTINRLSK
jgi:hypothetical protein